MSVTILACQTALLGASAHGLFSAGFGESLLALSQSASATFLNALWQGALIALCLAVCLKLTPRTSASLRFALWTAGFLLVAALPLLPVIKSWLESSLNSALGSSIAQPASAAQIAVAAHPWLQLDIRWSILITAVWMAASLYRAGDLVVHTVRLRKLWKSAQPVQADAARTHASFSLRKPVQLCTTTELDRPAVIGFLAPRILIPEWLMTQLTPGELDQIVLHESEHLRRGDDWTNLLQKLSLVLFPLNPVLIWMERRLCLEREMACDDGVVRVTNAPRAYATCLTSLAERGIHHRTEALSLGVLRRRPELVHRVHSLLRRGQVLGPVGSRSLAAAVTCAMAFGVVELSRCPQLVAFESTPHSAADASLPAAQRTAASASPVPDFAAGPSSPFRVVRTRALLPASPASPHAAAARRAAERRPANSDAPVLWKDSAGDRAVLTAFTGNASASVAELRRTVADQLALAADRPAADRPGANQAAADQATEQGWIVLTTWEQDSSSPSADSPAYRDSSRDSAARPNTSRTTVTQLVFRVIPAKQSGPNSLSPSPEAMPMLVPSRSGWLVLEL